jgi:hypothetical protein
MHERPQCGIDVTFEQLEWAVHDSVDMLQARNAFILDVLSLGSEPLLGVSVISAETQTTALSPKCTLVRWCFP